MLYSRIKVTPRAGDFSDHVKASVFQRLVEARGVGALDQAAVGVVVVGGGALGGSAGDGGHGVLAPRSG